MQFANEKLSKIAGQIRSKSQSAIASTIAIAKKQTALVLQSAVLLVLVGILSANYNSGINNKELNAGVLGGRGAAALDEVSSASVAALVAQQTGLIMADEVVGLAETLDSQTEVPHATQSSYVAKPKIIETDAKTRHDVVAHTVGANDTLSSIANKYNVTTDTIKWANEMTTNEVTAGSKLKIPPITGVLYTVQSGDTPKSLARRYKANAQQIVAFNDAEINGLVEGSTIVIPNGTKPAPAVNYSTSRVAGSPFSFGTVPQYGPNGYSYGYCTWYAANRSRQLGMTIPRNWGNANRWDEGARASGFTVSSAPKVGAIAQSDAGYYGHVGVVEEIKGDQVRISDMNGRAGWGRVDTNRWVNISSYEYIYR